MSATAWRHSGHIGAALVAVYVHRIGQREVGRCEPHGAPIAGATPDRHPALGARGSTLTQPAQGA